MCSDKDCMDDALESLDKLKELTIKMKKDKEKAENLFENSQSLSDAIQELINISGDLKDNHYKSIVVNALIFTIGDFLYKQSEHPMEGMMNIQNSIKGMFDHLYSIDFLKRKEEEEKKSENQQEWSASRD